MEHNPIARPQLESEISKCLKDLSPDMLKMVLINYAHELTILARGYFIDGEVDAARDCNEVNHRLLGFLISQLDTEDRKQALSMIETIVISASQKMRLQILNAILLRVAARSRN